MTHNFTTQQNAEQSELYKSNEFFLFYKNNLKNTYHIDTIYLGSCCNGLKLLKTGRLLK